MSRFDADFEPAGYNNEYELWEANLVKALAGKKGKKALAELREALLHLPEKKLISGAFNTVGLKAEVEGQPENIAPPDSGYEWTNWRKVDSLEMVKTEGEGVCAVGAFAWWKRVQKGATPDEAFRSLPRLLDFEEGGPWETAQQGKAAGMTYTLAYHIAYLNDEEWSVLNPEQRWEACLRWLDQQLAS